VPRAPDPLRGTPEGDRRRQTGVSGIVFRRPGCPACLRRRAPKARGLPAAAARARARRRPPGPRLPVRVAGG